jgi:DNA primase
MGGLIPQEIIDRILGQADIVEVVSSYLPLKRSGRNFKALCPFHEEKTPSFMVHPDKQIYKCFGCGKGGNAIHFVMERERLSFPEAVRALADRYGIQVPEARGERRESGLKKDALKQAVAMAGVFYHRCLVDEKRGGDQAMAYLADRGIAKATVERFGIGWAPDAWDAFLTEGRRKGFSDQVMAAAGLVARSEKTGNFFDMLRARVVLPIRDVRGTVVGFSGRVLDASEPKYLNTPETALFNKRNVLFGLHEAREAILRDKRVVVVEGQLDFITLFQAGFEAAVASQGTAFTPEQARLLKRYAETVVFAYDSDLAGRQATVRSFEALLDMELDVKVALMPPGFDPDRLVRDRGVEAFRAQVESAVDLLAFQYEVLKGEHDAATAAGRARIAAGLMETVRAATNLVLQNEYLVRCVQLTGVPEETLRIELRRTGKGRSVLGRQASAPPRAGANNAAERELVALAIGSEPVRQALREQIAPADLQDRDCRELLEAVFDALDETDAITAEVILRRVERPELARLVSEVTLDGPRAEPSPQTVEQLVNKVLEPRRKNRLKELKQLIDDASRAGTMDPALIEEYRSLRSTLRHWR